MHRLRAKEHVPEAQRLAQVERQQQAADGDQDQRQQVAGLRQRPVLLAAYQVD
jgi:hypothetical protein